MAGTRRSVAEPAHIPRRGMRRRYKRAMLCSVLAPARSGDDGGVMDHASRFTFSSPNSWPLEQSLGWAAEHGFTRVDFNADGAPNYPSTFTPERIRDVRTRADSGGVTLGIHTSSGVNMAEITPVMAAAADRYVVENFHLARDLGCSY